jgi:hypothetical protein
MFLSLYLLKEFMIAQVSLVNMEEAAVRIRMDILVIVLQDIQEYIVRQVCNNNKTIISHSIIYLLFTNTGIALFHYYVTSEQSINCFNAKDHGRWRGTEWQQHKEKHNKIALTKQRKGGITI